jgi:hypothetical protein
MHGQIHGARLGMPRAGSLEFHWTGGRYLAVSLTRATITEQNEQEVQ